MIIRCGLKYLGLLKVMTSEISDEEYCAFCSLSVANSKSVEQAKFTDKTRVKAEGILQILYIIIVQKKLTIKASSAHVVAEVIKFVSY
jgi:hypothetical protein